MAEQRDVLLEVLDLVGNEVYKERLLEFRKAKAEANAAIARADEAKAEAERVIKLAEQIKQKHHAELTAKQREHDDAAAEAKARILVANGQAADLLALKGELDQRVKEVDAKDKTLQEQSVKHGKRVADLDKREAALIEKESNLDQRHKKLAEALA